MMKPSSFHPSLSSSRTVWLCRHGERMDSIDPSWRDTTSPFHNPPLSPQGILEAQRTGEHLKDKGIRYIIASPFRRTIETAQHVGKALGLDIRLEAGVCEWLKADWFPHAPVFASAEDLGKLHPEADIDGAYKSRIRPNHPESAEDLQRRCDRVAEDLMEKFQSDFLVITHGAIVQGLARRWLSTPDLTLAGKTCSLSKISGKEKDLTLTLSADISHLTDLSPS